MKFFDTDHCFTLRVAVMLGVFVAKKSGGHLNPAVTLANCVYRRFPWHKFPIYMFAQMLGAMMGAMVVYFNYISAINMFEGGIDIRTVDNAVTSTASVFATYPVAFISTKGQFFSEFLSSAILMFCLFALVDAGVGNMLPIFLVFLIFGIGAAFGWETGYAMNMARDFGPRLVSYFLGYGTGVFTSGGTYFWVCIPSSQAHLSACNLWGSAYTNNVYQIPIVAPFVGTMTGGLVYDVFVHTGGRSPIRTPWTQTSDAVWASTFWRGVTWQRPQDENEASCKTLRYNSHKRGVHGRHIDKRMEISTIDWGTFRKQGV